MARRLRDLSPTSVHQVISRGVDRRPIYRDDDDRRRFLAWLGRAASRCEWECIAYTLMTNHYHLLIWTREPNLDVGMKLLNGVYAQGFNRKHGRSGHLFESRYFSCAVETEGNLLATARYDALNPVRAGLCSRPQAWRWSSYAATAGYRRAPRFLRPQRLLDAFDAPREEAIRRLREFVELDWNGHAGRDGERDGV